MHTKTLRRVRVFAWLSGSAITAQWVFLSYSSSTTGSPRQSTVAGRQSITHDQAPSPPVRSVPPLSKACTQLHSRKLLAARPYRPSKRKRTKSCSLTRRVCILGPRKSSHNLRLVGSLTRSRALIGLACTTVSTQQRSMHFPLSGSSTSVQRCTSMFSSVTSGIHPLASQTFCAPAFQRSRISCLDIGSALSCSGRSLFEGMLQIPSANHIFQYHF
mmetsp:Transcript_53641/g.96400  ORF Transcript_53641/g.96400 Transcript_53641/m.96400 type:complete len:216 (-) Transcript_53641:30-677(-)